MVFSDFNLSNQLLMALNEAGFVEPTIIQQRVYNVALGGRDVCGIAQTGTGKTLAYLLPCLKQLNYSKDKHTQILILVPTRELVTQVADAVKTLTTYMSVNVVGVYGGVNIKTQIAEILLGAEIIVATPGRLFDLIVNGTIKTKRIKKLIIDELDEMLNLGFRPQIKNLLDLIPAQRQNLLFSATITEEVESLMDTFFNSPVYITDTAMGTPLENIEQLGYEVPNFYTKVNLLKLLLASDNTMTKVLIFAITKKNADELYYELQKDYENECGVLHSNKDQNNRFSTLNKFHNGEFKFLIATDIVARGIDVNEVTHVINFDVPEVPENYIHRIGRTGRADKKGIAITFIKDKHKPFVEAIETLMKHKIKIQNLPDLLEISNVHAKDEMTVVKMKNTLVKMPSSDTKGAAFHQKSAKNSKVNNVIRKADKLRAKYGKPKTRGQKKK